MLGFESLFRALKSGILDDDPNSGGDGDHLNPAWCIVCWKVNSPAGGGEDDGVGGRVSRRSRGDSTIWDLERSMGSGSSSASLLEEFCHQLRIVDEDFLGRLSRRGPNQEWAVCPACVPFIEKAVQKRRQCLVLEDRVSRLQYQILRELKRLKEGMGQFYVELRKIDGLIDGRDENPQCYLEGVEDTRRNDSLPFRNRVVEVLLELDVYRNEVASKIGSPSMSMAGDNCEAEPILVKVENQFGIEVEGDFDTNWGLIGTSDINYDVKIGEGEAATAIHEESEDSDHHAGSVAMTKWAARRGKQKDDEESDAEWGLSGVEEDDHSETDDGDDDDGDGGYGHVPPKKPKRSLPLKSEPGPRKKRRLTKVKSGVVKQALALLAYSSGDKDDCATGSLVKKTTSRGRPRSSRKKIKKSEGESDTEWNLSGMVEDVRDPGDGSDDHSYVPSHVTKSKIARKRKVSTKRRNKLEKEPKKEISSADNDSISHIGSPVDGASQPPPRRRRRRPNRPDKVVKKCFQQIPCLSKADKFKTDHDLELAGLSYLRKYFILRSNQEQNKIPKPTPSTLVVAEITEEMEKDLLGKKYNLDYDPTTGKVTLNQVEVILNEEKNLIQCSSCPFKVTQSEVASTLKHNKSVDVIISKMEQRIADHILGVHLGAFNCPFCDLKTTLWNRYYSHVRYVHMNFSKCDICGRPGMNRQKLLRHKWTHLSADERMAQESPAVSYRDRANMQDTMNCETCGKLFYTKGGLRTHRKTHQPDGDRVVCPVCGKSIRRQYYEGYHKLYTCPLPGSEPTTARDPRRRDGIKCIHCPMTLRNMFSLKQHIGRMHSTKPEERAICPICGKDFPRLLNLKLHMRSHQNEKSWKCGWDCGEEFSDKRRRTEHETVCPAKPEIEALPPTSNPGGEKDPHQCLHCTAVLKNRQLFRQHMKRYHSPQAETRAHACPTCDKRFRMRGDLTAHMKTHQERIYKCSWGCGWDFNVRGNWKSHETTCKLRPV